MAAIFPRIDGDDNFELGCVLCIMVDVHVSLRHKGNMVVSTASIPRKTRTVLNIK